MAKESRNLAFPSPLAEVLGGRRSRGFLLPGSFPIKRLSGTPRQRADGSAVGSDSSRKNGFHVLSVELYGSRDGMVRPVFYSQRSEQNPDVVTDRFSWTF